MLLDICPVVPLPLHNVLATGDQSKTNFDARGPISVFWNGLWAEMQLSTRKVVQVSLLYNLYLKRDWFILAAPVWRFTLVSHSSNYVGCWNKWLLCAHSLVVNGKKPGRGYLPTVALALIVGIQWYFPLHLAENRFHGCNKPYNDLFQLMLWSYVYTYCLRRLPEWATIDCNAAICRSSTTLWRCSWVVISLPTCNYVCHHSDHDHVINYPGLSHLSYCKWEVLGGGLVTRL